MQKPADFDNVQAFGEFKPLPAGGYVCRIMAVEETQARTNRAPMIKISLDIAEGQYKNYYANLYKSSTKTDKKWSPGAIVNQLVYDTNGANTTNRGFKTFITSVCESNPGFNVAWGEGFSACFRGKLVGVLFGREEYVGTDGKNHWSTKALNFRSVKTIHDGTFETPADKPLTATQGGTYGGYGNYTPSPVQTPPQGAQPPYQAQQAPTAANLTDFEEIIVDANDLPF